MGNKTKEAIEKEKSNIEEYKKHRKNALQNLYNNLIYLINLNNIYN